MDDYIKLSSQITNYIGLFFSICSTIMLFYVAWINKNHLPLQASDTFFMYMAVLMFVMSYLRSIVLYDTEQVNEFSQSFDAKLLVMRLCIIQTVMYYIVFLFVLFILIYYLLFNEQSALLLWIFMMLTFLVISIHIEIHSIIHNEINQLMSFGWTALHSNRAS